LKTEFEDGAEDEGEEEDGGDENEHEDEDDEHEHEHEDDDSVSGSSEDEDEERENQNDVNDAASNRYRNVELFMKGMTRDKDTLQYLDQVKQVAKFCKQARLGLESGATGRSSKRIALLDDRVGFGTIGPKAGNCRQDRDPLTSEQLREELSQPVYKHSNS
jgi:hypothetical protein